MRRPREAWLFGPDIATYRADLDESGGAAIFERPTADVSTQGVGADQAVPVKQEVPED